MKPFHQRPFGELPEAPHRPHGYFATEALDLEVDTRAFGRMKVHVRKHGSGPPLLLLHGLMTSSYSWRYAFEPLGEHFTCYAPDLPANGRSSRVLGVPYTPQNLASWTADVQRALGIRGCAVIGNSMGGYLMMQLALDDPESMSRLVNLHSPGVVIPRLRALGVALSLPLARRALASWVQRAPLRWAHKNVHYYDESLKSLEEAREYGAPLANPAGAEGFVSYLADTMHPRWMSAFQRRLAARRDAGKAFPVPLQLIFAERDPMVPPRVGVELHKLVPDAEMVKLRQASHFAHVDAPDRFLPPALRFLRTERAQGNGSQAP